MRDTLFSLSIPRLRVAPHDPAALDEPPGDVRQEWFDHAGQLIATGGRDDEQWWMHWRGLGTFWFDETGDVRGELGREGSPEMLHDVFGRGVVPVVLLARGFEALHASAVLTDHGVVAFCATSGTGKSTIAMALAATGFTHFADDTVLYRISAGRPLVSYVPSMPRVDDSVRTVPGLQQPSMSTAPPLESAPLLRIYQLRRNPALDPPSPRFTRVPASARFETLLAHGHPFEMGTEHRRRVFLENLLALARDVDVWECEFAPALPALSSLAASIRAQLSAP
jgi:hypothetical protein